ncbi:MAG: acetate--CoA ligase family protein [Spirochaetaceae bacterium]
MSYSTTTTQDALHSLFKPKTVAVVGASEKPGPGRQVIENLRQIGYEGEIVPIHPKYENVLGIPCYSSLGKAAEDGKRIDVAALVLGRDKIVPVLEEAAKAGVKAAWAFAAGFAEADTLGEQYQQDLVRICRENNMAFLGPNCVGYLHPNGRSATFSAPAPKEVKAGNIGMVAQSGYLGLAVANNSRGLGFSLLATTGNEAVIDAGDVMEYMLHDEKTEVVLAFIEQFRRPEKLFKVARLAREKKKPIVLIKVGKSDMAQRATVAHTGALAGSDDVQDAIFEKLGIIRVDDFDEMFETAELLSKTRNRLPKSNRVFGITLSGGVISLMGDLSVDLDIEFPGWSEKGKSTLADALPDFGSVANPLDAWGSGRIEETYETCLRAVAEEDAGDFVLIAQDVPAGMAPRQVEQYETVARAAVKLAGEFDKPFVMVNNQSGGFDPTIASIMEEGSVPLLQGTREALKAVHSTIKYAQFLRSEAPTFEVTPNEEARALLPKGKRVLDEYTSKKIISSYGVPVTEEFLCSSADEVAEKAAYVGYPVVLKLISPDIQHKTEAGVVRLDVKDEEQARRTYDEVVENARNYNPDAKVDGVLCYHMVEEPVVEALVGIISDPNFGPAVVFGVGGVMVEVIRDRALLVPPFSREEAKKKIDETKGSKLLYGFRGKEKGDIEALLDVLVRVGELTADLSHRIEALDINPLFILPEGKGVVAVDALLALSEERQ